MSSKPQAPNDEIPEDLSEISSDRQIESQERSGTDEGVPVKLNDLIKLLNDRGKSHGITAKTEDPEHGILASAKIPDGREHRTIWFHDPESIRKFLGADCDQNRFIPRFDAIWNPSKGLIEARIYSLAWGPIPRIWHSSLYRRLFDDFTENEDFDPYKHVFVIQESSATRKLTVLIGPATDEKMILTDYPITSPRPLTLKIIGTDAKTSDDVEAVLGTVANSVFFQLDLAIELPLRLAPYRPFRFRVTEPNKVDAKALTYLRRAWDEKPLTLYWYGRNTPENLLLQFLAFYQVVEYYFPQFSEKAATKAARDVITYPTFNPQSDGDILRLLKVLQPLVKSGFGKEQAQLRSVIEECVNGDELWNFLLADEERRGFFSKKSDWAQISQEQIVMNNRTDQFMAQVAVRIYDIRCKIVHSKDGGVDGEGEMILPFSEAAANMDHDVDLIKFIAQRVLVTCGQPLSL